MLNETKLRDNLKQATREMFTAFIRDIYESADDTYLNGEHDAEIEDILETLISDIEANIELAANDIKYDIDLGEDEEDE